MGDAAVDDASRLFALSRVLIVVRAGLVQTWHPSFVECAATPVPIAEDDVVVSASSMLLRALSAGFLARDGDVLVVSRRPARGESHVRAPTLDADLYALSCSIRDLVLGDHTSDACSLYELVSDHVDVLCLLNDVRMMVRMMRSPTHPERLTDAVSARDASAAGSSARSSASAAGSSARSSASDRAGAAASVRRRAVEQTRRRDDVPAAAMSAPSSVPR
jgi:hypothetical protein